MTWRHDEQVLVTILPGDPVCALAATGLDHAVGAYHGITSRQVPYDVAYFCIDPCTQVLWDSLVNERNNLTAAAKAERAKRRAARAELSALEQQARTMRKP